MKSQRTCEVLASFPGNGVSDGAGKINGARCRVKDRRRDLGIVLIVLGVLAGGVPRPVCSQAASRGSRLLALDHWAYEYVRRLRDRGYLSNLNPLVQPYTRAQIAEGVAALDPGTLGPPLAAWVRLLRDEFAQELAGNAVSQGGVEGGGGARASSSDRLDATRPLGDGGIWPFWRAGGWFESGPVAAEARLYGDMYLADDPDGLDPGQRRGGRSDHAYASVTTPVATVALGRFARNWGPAGTQGLLVSDAATPYPQIGLELRAGSFTLRGFTGELETLAGLKRHITAHRLDYRRPDLVVSFGEAVLYAHSGGGPLLRYLNPLELLFFDQANEPADAVENLLLSAQAWARRGGSVFYAEVLLDDISVGPDRVPAPPRYALMAGARLTSLASWLEVGAEYQQVSAWAYRTTAWVDRYSYLDRGIGAPYADYDQLAVRAHMYPQVAGLRITPSVVLQRQGEGSLRDSISGGLEGRSALFLGTRERTLGVGIGGRYQPVRQLWIGWDVERNVLRNASHVGGARRSEWVVLGTLQLRFGFRL